MKIVKAAPVDVIGNYVELQILITISCELRNVKNVLLNLIT